MKLKKKQDQEAMIEKGISMTSMGYINSQVGSRVDVESALCGDMRRRSFVLPVFEDKLEESQQEMTGFGIGNRTAEVTQMEMAK